MSYLNSIQNRNAQSNYQKMMFLFLTMKLFFTAQSNYQKIVL